MRSVCQALNLITMTLGSMVSAGIQSIFAVWFTDDLNKGHLEGIFLLYSLLVVVNLGWFMKVARGYQYKEDRLYEELPETQGLLDSNSIPVLTSDGSDDDQHEDTFKKDDTFD
eukprot:TRINITY_DN39682_c0_g2_i4.p1 TRINITY_DN39682_c0_g2~~TRINITY_DN39682_c0_g2_i4.p1  ORF type:complete len:113 (+),score=16.41 TRINITY_DN39682_c0_g2_i4:111-449(+)